MEEIAKYEGRTSLDRSAKDPDKILAEAKKAADALIRVVSAKPKKFMLNGEQYLEFEDWQTLGRFYEYTVRIDSTEAVNIDGVKGWQARASVIDWNGNVVSSAEAMCLNDEENWSSRTKYEYQYILKDGTKSTQDPPKDQIIWIDNPNKPGKKMPKRERIKLPDVAVPSFQLRSMAQTRASAKAFRNVLAWVVVLAGYKPTPAEELPNAHEESTKKGTPEQEDVYDFDPPGNEPTKNKSVITAISDVRKVKDSEWFKVVGILDGNEQSFPTKEIRIAEAARKEKGSGLQFRIEYSDDFVIVSMNVQDPK